MNCICFPNGTKPCKKRAVFQVNTYCKSSKPKRSKLYYCASCMREMVQYNLSIKPFGIYAIARLDEVTT